VLIFIDIPFLSPKIYNIIQCKIDYCIIKLILMMLLCNKQNARSVSLHTLN